MTRHMHEEMNPKVVNAEYAVRGAITNRAAEIDKELASGKGNYPFDSVLYCNIGNPQSLNQKPISYPRQLLAACEYPEVRPLLLFGRCGVCTRVTIIYRVFNCDFLPDRLHVRADKRTCAALRAHLHYGHARLQYYFARLAATDRHTAEPMSAVGLVR